MFFFVISHGQKHSARGVCFVSRFQQVYPFSAQIGKVVGVVVVVVFKLNRPFYPASSVHPVSVLIPYPREIMILWSHRL